MIENPMVTGANEYKAGRGRPFMTGGYAGDWVYEVETEEEEQEDE